MSSARVIAETMDQVRSAGQMSSRPGCLVTALTPGLIPSWNLYVGSHPQSTFFHTLAWRDAVADVFGHEPVYLVALRERRIIGILPMFVVASRLAGRMAVSVPYGVGGGIIADDDAAVAALFRTARRVTESRGCSTIDLRSEIAWVPDLPIVDCYAAFRRELPTASREVLDWLPRKARAAARNARNKHKLSVSFGDEHLHEAWRLYSISMRRLGSLNYPVQFFERLIQLTPGRHWVSVVRHRRRNIAGLVTFLFKDSVMPYFVGMTDDAKRYSAANYVYLTVMERGVDFGYRIFDFGRTRRDNSGSYDFKRFQGFDPQPLEYQCYVRRGHKPPNLTPDNPKFRLARNVWSRLPLKFTQAVGARLARHIPG